MFRKEIAILKRDNSIATIKVFSFKLGRSGKFYIVTRKLYKAQLVNIISKTNLINF